MQYEVEMKFRMADMGVLEARLKSFGAAISTAREEIDVYFAHPSRDFSQTDEALRIRRKELQNFLTYKGPKIDPTTKTRREIDLALPEGEDTAQKWTGLLEALGFSIVGKVCKTRRKAHIPWEGRNVEVSLDAVEGLGVFAELELVVEPAEVEAAKNCILSLAKSLGLESSERRSYLELLLEQTGER